jgi:hypothetical protein
MNNRDLLLEFIQWLVDNPSYIHDIFDYPEDEESGDAAIETVDKFLEIVS